MKRRQTSQHFNLQAPSSNKDMPVSIPDPYTMLPYTNTIQHGQQVPEPMRLQTLVFAAELYLLFMAGYYTTLIQPHNDRGL
jgi:hypothetical protein